MASRSIGFAVLGLQIGRKKAHPWRDSRASTGVVPSVAGAWAGEAGWGRLGKTGCLLETMDSVYPLPSYPSCPASQDPRKDEDPDPQPCLCWTWWRLQCSLVYSSSSFSGLEPRCPSRARGLGTSWGWRKKKEGALTGVWLRKGIGPGCKVILGPCLTVIFLSIPTLTCGQLGELYLEPPGSHGLQRGGLVFSPSASTFRLSQSV